MPVIFRDSGLRYYFFSNDGLPREPRHVHVKGGGKDAKIWPEPEVALAESSALIPANLRLSCALFRNNDHKS